MKKLAVLMRLRDKNYLSMKNTFAGQPKYTIENGVVKSDKIGIVAGWVIGLVLLTCIVGGRFVFTDTSRSDILVGTESIIAVFCIGFFLYKLIRHKEIDWMYVALLLLLSVLYFWWE